MIHQPLGRPDSLVYLAPAPANALPGLILTTSPSYRMPLALYGSGLRNLRTWAANSPPACLSAPLTWSLVGPSSCTVTSEGIATLMGLAKPTERTRFLPFISAL